jgi:NTE family protein
MRIPLAISATDFVTGDPVAFTTGPIIDPIRASCAYPGMFLPVNVNGRLMVDGLLAHSVPAEPLRQMGADRVIAIYLSAHWVNAKGPRHIFDVIGQCFSIAQAKMCDVWKPHADLVLEPNVDGFTYDGFDRAKDLVKVGEESARAAMPQIRAWFEAARKTQTVTTAVPSKGGAPAPTAAPALAK